MAFDFGTKSIGSAIGQEVTGTASPLKAFKANDGIPNWDDIEKLIKEWQPNLLVVGLPTDLHGKALETITPRAKKFAQRLQGRYGLQLKCTMNACRPEKLAPTYLRWVATKRLVKEMLTANRRSSY